MLGVAALLLAPVCLVGGVALAVGGRGSPLLRRLAAKEPYDRGRTHPPARLRLRAVDDLQAEAGLVVPDNARWARIDAELAPVMAAVAQQARDRHDATTDRHAGRRPARAGRTATAAAP